jgi:hypothetical protein
MLKEQLTSKVAGIILEHVRSKKGRLTELSDWCRINRKEFNIRGLSQMKFHRLLRILYALHLECEYYEWKQLWDEISETIQEFSDEYDFTLLDE